MSNQETCYFCGGRIEDGFRGHECEPILDGPYGEDCPDDESNLDTRLADGFSMLEGYQQ